MSDRASVVCARLAISVTGLARTRVDCGFYTQECMCASDADILLSGCRGAKLRFIGVLYSYRPRTESHVTVTLELSSRECDYIIGLILRVSAKRAPYIRVFTEVDIRGIRAERL